MDYFIPLKELDPMDYNLPRYILDVANDLDENFNGRPWNRERVENLAGLLEKVANDPPISAELVNVLSEVMKKEELLNSMDSLRKKTLEHAQRLKYYESLTKEEKEKGLCFCIDLWNTIIIYQNSVYQD